MGSSELGHYYNQTNGLYLGSWSRDRDNFVDDSKINENLFELDAWKNRHKKSDTSIISNVVQSTASWFDFRKLAPPPDPRDLAGKYIAFIGDSFCATVSPKHYSLFKDMPGHEFRGRIHSSAWPSLVVDTLEANIAPYGFLSRSWWYSWQKFWQDWQDRLDRLDAVIFVHTNHERFNHEDDKVINLLSDRVKEVFKHLHAEDMNQAVRLYYTHLFDKSFHKWSQQQFFRYLRDHLPDCKIIHYFCFDFPSRETQSVLPGMIFSSPLYLLSRAELQQTESFLDTRANHFNDHNNQALADLTVQALNHYRPGVYEIPWQEFYQLDPSTYRKSASAWKKHHNI